MRPLLFIGSVVFFSVLADDWIAGASILVLCFGWKYLSREPGPPVIAAAFSHQWLQITIAVFYTALTGRHVTEMQNSDYRPMMLIGLGALIAMFGGFYLTVGWKRRLRPISDFPQFPVTFSPIAIAYVASVILAGGLQSFAWSHPQVTQMVLVLKLLRYALLYILIRRLASPEFKRGWIALILLAEVAIGFTGYQADFRQPLVIVGIAVFGAVDRRRARTWIVLGMVVALGIGAVLLWTAIKPGIRKEYYYSRTNTDRLKTVARLAEMSLTSSTVDWKYRADTTVSRLWTVYYPALAVARVPKVLPYENGKLMGEVIQHMITPRFLFPEKPGLPSESDKVRKYSGVWVGGREIMTTYAFGYAAESYVDFGVPLMFLPIFIFGILMGRAYTFLIRSIRYSELRSAVVIVIFWSSLSLFEVSWVIMAGLAATQIVVLWLTAILAERLLSPRRGGSRPIVFRLREPDRIFGRPLGGPESVGG